jgi:hypothetical protein
MDNAFGYLLLLMEFFVVMSIGSIGHHVHTKRQVSLPFGKDVAEDADVMLHLAHILSAVIGGMKHTTAMLGNDYLLALIHYDAAAGGLYVVDDERLIADVSQLEHNV